MYERTHGQELRMEEKVVFFRNDDADLKTKELTFFTECFLEREMPIVHAVIPGKLAEDTKKWFGEIKERTPHLLELTQHGWMHPEPPNEFGGDKSYEVQREAVAKGRARMEKAFGDQFFPAFSFPGGFYNEHSMKVLDDLGFKVVSCHNNPKWKSQLLYRICRPLGKGRCMGRHVSYHMRRYPGTGLLEIGTTVGLIDRYYDLESSHMKPLDELMREFVASVKRFEVTGVLFHHRYHNTEEYRVLLEDVLDAIQSYPGIRFATLEEIYNEAVSR
jgi:hypothetical protein